MIIVHKIPRSYDDAVRLLARWHGEEQAFPLTIFAIPDPRHEEVRLIEVSDEFPQPGPVVPILMGRSKEFPFRSAVALATEDEWRQLQRGEIELKEDWDISKATRVWPDE